MQRILTLLFVLPFLAACTPIHTAIHNETGFDVYVQIRFNVSQPDAFGPLERGAQLNLTETPNEISLITFSYGGTTCRLGPAGIQHSIAGREYNMIRIDLKPCT